MTARYVRAPRLNQHVLITPVDTVRDARLSYRARGVLARLLSNADGYYMTAEDLAAQGREGRDAIRAALQELRDARYLVAHALTNARGQFSGTEIYVYDKPVNGVGGDRTPEKPSAGFPPADKPPLKRSYNVTGEKSSSKHAADVKRSDAAAVRKVRHQQESGLVWYEPDDSPIEVERIEATYAQAEIDSAIAEMPASKEPVPGVVERLILARRRAVEADAKRERLATDHHRRVTMPCEDRETAARKAEEQMAVYTAEANK